MARVGFEGRDVVGPRADSRDGRWYIAAGETLEELARALRALAARTRAVVESHDLADIGHLDSVSELAGGQTGE